MQEVKDKESDWDYMIEANMVTGDVEKVTRVKMVIAMTTVKPGKEAGALKYAQ